MTRNLQFVASGHRINLGIPTLRPHSRIINWVIPCRRMGEIMRKQWWLGGVAVAVLAGGAGVYATSGGSAPAAKKDEAKPRPGVPGRRDRQAVDGPDARCHRVLRPAGRAEHGDRPRQGLGQPGPPRGRRRQPRERRPVAGPDWTWRSCATRSPSATPASRRCRPCTSSPSASTRPTRAWRRRTSSRRRRWTTPAPSSNRRRARCCPPRRSSARARCCCARPRWSRRSTASSPSGTRCPARRWPPSSRC